jgi:preprotein translocase subunit SecA
MSPLVRYKRQLEQINGYEKELMLLADVELKNKTKNLKRCIINGDEEYLILPQAFALVREAGRRILGLRLFDTQLIGGIILNEGKIAEMKTGEGKTLAALLPSFLSALSGKGTHVITVNDYLAKRDSHSVGQVHRFLGLTVGLVQSEMVFEDRRKNYNCDIVYLTNNVLGFDYLRDNMVLKPEEIVQKPFFLLYCRRS